MEKKDWIAPECYVFAVNSGTDPSIPYEFATYTT